MSTSSPTRPAGSPAAAAAGPRRGLSGKVIFFVVLLVVFVAYTEMAFGMRWLTSAGQIGPGYFPRIIGVLLTAVTVWAVWHSWRDPADELSVEEEVGDADLGRHPVAMAVAVAASFVLLLTLLTLGAIVASAIFCFGLLAYLNPGQWRTNVILSVAVPLVMYLLFQTALNAGLPSGILPSF